MEATPPLQQPTAHGKRSGAARRKLRKERQAMLDAQFANLEIDPDKGWKLPPEIVYHIMGISAPPTDTRLLSDAARNHRHFLFRLSLVCTAWRMEAQRILWTGAVLKSDSAIRRFLSGGERVRLTRQLVFGPTENLELLSIRSVNNLDPGTLATPNLKNHLQHRDRSTCPFDSKRWTLPPLSGLGSSSLPPSSSRF
ncbi:hypothetical protein BCR35DRAFT_181814 [Leucosporidium creatinivorum]|uniref:Uncharacterized protein n=1 Tax=Leucosporidium creatinivorum TaxID=106004 RepID=A0A1Y2E615_9BASI|nr:hypothetical protein BCR35DRAFT_181814 [Leucosporidium creatinivorum]